MIAKLSAWGVCFAVYCFGAAQIHAADLISHNGFSQCWSKSVTESQFAALAPPLTSATGCIPAGHSDQTQSSWCQSTMCDDGSPGCPVRFNGGSGMLAASAPFYYQFVAVDDFTAPLTIPVTGSCVIAYQSMDNVRFDFTVGLSTYLDGNGGLYVWKVNGGVDFFVAGLTSSNYSLDGSFGCQIANIGLDMAYGPLVTATLDAQAFSGSPLVGQSICPVQ